MNEQYNRSVGISAETDLGLKSFMLGTYRYMAMAMGVTGLVAYFFGQYIQTNPQLMNLMFGNMFMAIAFVGGIMLAFGAIGRKLPTMSLGGVLAFLFGFAAFMGVFISPVSFMYNPQIIAKVFFMTVAMFAGLSMFGYTAKMDLGGIAKYAFIVFGAFVLVNILGMRFEMFRLSGPMDMIFTVVALGAIAIITAFQTQTLKRIYYGAAGNTAMMSKLSAFGAASLLLTFINMFQMLLSLFGRE
ncbi:MAG: Bax inhibitor-1/YccA family protein [Hellea sp.]